METEEGTYRAKGRGLLKRNKNSIFVGDVVEAFPPEEGEDDGIITEIYPRKNIFLRPPIANVDTIVVTVALSNPEPNTEMIDKLLVMAESKDIDIILCINKSDLEDETGKKIYDIYKNIYPTVLTSCLEDGEGIDELRKLMAGKKVAFAGPSGVGKSSLTNILVPNANMETGDISRKLSRGKHTTRHVEIFTTEDGYLFDTPGFTSFDIDDFDIYELDDFFPDISKWSKECKFGDCLHLDEPDCGVKEALIRGDIKESRYNSYRRFIDNIKRNKKF